MVVAGPSGAGKDTLLNAASGLLANVEGIRFITRDVSRAKSVATERERAVSAAEFAALRAANGYALSWTANGNDYGIPIGVHDVIQKGEVAVVNGSRDILEEAAERFARVRVIIVTAPPELIEKRLRTRARESPKEIATRLAREAVLRPLNLDHFLIENNSTIECGAEKLVGAILS